jgi:hypothetical protein
VRLGLGASRTGFGASTATGDGASGSPAALESAGTADGAAGTAAGVVMGCNPEVATSFRGGAVCGFNATLIMIAPPMAPAVSKAIMCSGFIP